MFNKYQWELYLNAGGRQVAEMFEENLTGNFSEEYAEEIAIMHRRYCPMTSFSEEIENELSYLFSDILSKESNPFENDCRLDNFILPDNEYTIKSALDFIFNLEYVDAKFNDKEKFEIYICDNIIYMSTVLAIQIPELFIPYYFQCNFNIVEKICEEFGIDIPEIPAKKDYRGRFFYYGELCATLNDFREINNMTPYEFCAFLYDYAPKFIGGIDSYIIKDIPEPTSAFFIGAPHEAEDLAKDNDIIACWQCSLNAQPGDYAVMYLKNPISSVDSVWRCISDGFNDPFAYYYRFVYIAKPHKIKRVSKNKLEKDRIFKKLGIVRKNMQGINGIELKPSEYNHLMELAKSPDLMLKYSQPLANVEISREKDVEEQLIKPLLKRLKYKDNDYTQQLHIELGNHNTTLIPDFILLPDETVGKKKGFAIVEAKNNIPNKKAFEDAKVQARSYARQLLTKYSVIASDSKIFISSCDDDFENDFFVKTWEELENSDNFSELYKIIGKK